MTLEEALQSHDIDELIDSLTAYAHNRLKTIDTKQLNGKTPADFVAEVLMKIAVGERDWSKAACTFKEFVFGCLRSHISNFLKNFEPLYESELPENESSSEYDSDEEGMRQKAVELLKENGANNDEVAVFECWIDGITKPAKIADQLGINIKIIYNIIRRLTKKLPLLKSKIKKPV